jgi:cytidylate kinase
MKTSEQVMEAVERARKRWSRRAGELLEVAHGERAPAYTVAISRESGAGGASVAQAAAKRLGWSVYDHELLDKISSEAGLRSELLESLGENWSQSLSDRLEAFEGVRKMGGGTYGRQVAQTMVALSVHGKCVIIGRGATMVLPPETTLRVRLVAPIEYRIAQVCAEQGVSEGAARQHVERTDKDRSAFVAQFFQRDVADMHLYDLAINMSRYSTEDAAGLIVEGLDRLRATQRERREPQAAW